MKRKVNYFYFCIMHAIILSRRDRREYDQIISLYTLERGKVEALARGVKKILSKNSSHLEPGCFVEVEIIPGKEVAHIGSVQPINIYKNIRADLSSSMAVGHALALVDRLVHPHEKDTRVFELIQKWLEWVDGGDMVDPVAGVDLFAIKLFQLLGFDIAYDDKITEPTRARLMVFLNDGSKNLPVVDRRAAHGAVLQFARFHSESRLTDWGDLSKFI